MTISSVSGRYIGHQAFHASNVVSSRRDQVATKSQLLAQTSSLAPAQATPVVLCDAIAATVHSTTPLAEVPITKEV